MSRKYKNAPKRKRTESLPKRFHCPSCHGDLSCRVHMDFGKKKGRITCGDCEATHQMPINNLTDPIDVYNDWIDLFENEADP